MSVHEGSKGMIINDLGAEEIEKQKNLGGKNKSQKAFHRKK